MTPMLLVTSILFCTIALLSVPRSQTMVIWLPLVVFVEIGFCCYVLGFLAMLSIGYNPYIVIASNFTFGLCAIAYANHRSKKLGLHEKRFFIPIANTGDVSVVLMLLTLVGIFTYLQFGYPPRVSFSTTDPAIHLREAIDIFQGGLVAGQYLTRVVSAVALSIFSGFFDSFHYYIVFECAEELLSFISGLALYSVLSVACRRMSLFAKLALVFFYYIGYPLNNMIYGFSYLGAGVTTITCLVFLCLNYSAMRREKGLVLFCASILLLELIITYVLFAAPVYLAFLIILIAQIRRHRDRSWHLLLTAILAVSLPLVIGYFVMYLPIFDSKTTVTEAIANEGGIYKALYANFIFIAPLSLYGLTKSWRRPRMLPCNIMTLIFTTFAFCLFLGCIFRLVSSYYFAKTYYVLWMMFFVYAAIGISSLQLRAASALACYALTWSLIFGLFAFRLDDRLGEARPNINPTPVADQLFPIYSYNFSSIGVRGLDQYTMELFEEAEDLSLVGSKIGIVSNDYFQTWFQTLLQDEYQKNLWQATDEEIRRDIHTADYMVVMEVSDAFPSLDGSNYSDMRTWLPEESETVFQNGSGYIVKLPANDR